MQFNKVNNVHRYIKIKKISLKLNNGNPHKVYMDVVFLHKKKPVSQTISKYIFEIYPEI